MSKPVKRVDVSKLTPEQRQALGQFIRDCKQAEPHLQEMREAARTIHQGLLQSRRWDVGEAPHDQPPDQSLWHVKPQINYVDHIEGVT